jgi:RES domain-containing protein
LLYFRTLLYPSNMANRKNNIITNKETYDSVLYPSNMANRKNNIITNKETYDSVLYPSNMANRKNNIITNKETCDSEDDHGTHQYRHKRVVYTGMEHFLFIWLKCSIVFLTFTFSKNVFKLNQICK